MLGGVSERVQDKAGSRCVRLHAGEPRDVQLSAGQVPAVQEAVGRPEQVQEVQEGLESVRTLLGSVREVLLAQAGVEPVQEVPEVQDHPSRLPPDLAALAHPEHPQASPRQCLWGRGCPPGRAEGQRR